MGFHNKISLVHVLLLSLMTGTHGFASTCIRPWRLPSTALPKSITYYHASDVTYLNKSNKFYGGDIAYPTTTSTSAINSRRTLKSPLFAETSGGSKDTPPAQKRQNLRVLGQLSFSGLLAYGYMRYFAVVTIGSFIYYVGTRTIGKKGFKNGEWVLLAAIIASLALIKKLVGPATFAIELVVTTFFSYLFVNLAQGNL